MPIASGHGNWPSEYGVGIQGHRLTQKPQCAICTQKKCFNCEHLTPVKNSILLNEPYLAPKEKTLADQKGTVANFKRQHNIQDDKYYSEMYIYNKKNSKIIKPTVQKTIHPDGKEYKTKQVEEGCCVIC